MAFPLVQHEVALPNRLETRVPVRAAARVAAWLSGRFARAGLGVLFAVTLACRTVAPPPPGPKAPQAPTDGCPPRVALVLGGGGARGFAHVGVLRVLERARIPVEIIVGSSVGSLVGALYAGPWNAQELEGIARRLGRDDFFDFGVHPALFGTGLASGRRIENFVRENLSEDRIERLRIPFAAVATDLDSGNPVVLRAGDVARAVRASCAIPGVFEPVRIEGQLLVDGGLVQNLPVKVARDMGADVVIAVDVTAIGAAKAPRNFVEVILRAVNIVVHAEVEDARRDADVFLAPAVGEVGFIDFDRKLEAIAAGIASATAALPKIRQVLAEWERARDACPAGTGAPLPASR
jgi:NTE family protein